jgi:16S rRNA (guanine(966)-N(2))-methyltransferase RsmD
MRVITGSARGRKLSSLPGLETRPTSDWTKESIFNIIQFDIEGRRTLDLFAGTGQMGIEALSRGAESCVFVDTRRECGEVIRKNLEHTGFTGVSKVELTDFRAYLKRVEPESFGLIFLDPPYGEGMLRQSVSQIMRRDLLQFGGIIVCEGERTEELPGAEPPYYKGREYNYGKTRITIYSKKRGDADEDSGVSGQL